MVLFYPPDTGLERVEGFAYTAHKCNAPIGTYVIELPLWNDMWFIKVPPTKDNPLGLLSIPLDDLPNELKAILLLLNINI